MTHQHLSDTARLAAVRATLAAGELQDRLVDVAERRVNRLRDDGEQGSQTAEYAMVGGVGAAAAGAMIYCIKNRSVIENLLETVVTVLLRQIRSWF